MRVAFRSAAPFAIAHSHAFSFNHNFGHPFAIDYGQRSRNRQRGGLRDPIAVALCLFLCEEYHIIALRRRYGHREPYPERIGKIIHGGLRYPNAHL